MFITVVCENKSLNIVSHTLVRIFSYEEIIISARFWKLKGLTKLSENLEKCFIEKTSSSFIQVFDFFLPQSEFETARDMIDSRRSGTGTIREPNLDVFCSISNS